VESLTRRGLSLSLGLLFLVPVDVRAASVDKDLEGIKRKIEKEKQGISQAQKREGSILQSLGQIEGDFERKTKKLKEASSRLDSISTEMQKKQAEAEKIADSIRDRQELLRRRAVALYRWQRSGGPFTLLNGGVSLSAFLQHKHYLETTVSYDRDLIASLNNELERQELLRNELAQRREDLDSQRQILTQAKDSVRQQAEKKKQMLASIRQEKETRLRALKELEQAALRLQKMMEELSKRAVSKPPEFPSGTGLGAMRGKLEWPVKGELISAFGKTRHKEFDTEVFRNGIDIQAPLGQEIKAVEKGTVVFADRFSGYGRMIVVDHGERYYTIYAHLSEMFKKNGDSVKRGEALGLVGDSDSFAGAGLYFEMRKDGRSVDPVPWFRKP
jgi:septal ring factor EnvC (AmiA/AmiB activator)